MILALFVWLAALVADHPGPFTVDRTVMDAFTGLRTSALTAMAKVIAVATDPAVTAGVVVVVALWLLLRSRDRRSALFLACTSAATAVMLEAAKLVVDRPRPPIGMQLVPETNNSFPSGHVTGVVSVLGALALVAVHRGMSRSLVAAVWVTLVGIVVLDRLYLGVHWFSDILGALLLGATILLTAATLGRMVVRRQQRREHLRSNESS